MASPLALIVLRTIVLTDSSENTDKMYEKIVKNPLTFSDVFTTESKSILKGLLTRDPSIRLGTKGADEIKKHPFFAKVLVAIYLSVHLSDRIHSI